MPFLKGRKADKFKILATTIMYMFLFELNFLEDKFASLVVYFKRP